MKNLFLTVLGLITLALISAGCASGRSTKPFHYNQVGTTKYHQLVNGKLEEVERAEYNEEMKGDGLIPPGMTRNPYMGMPGRTVNGGQLVTPIPAPAPQAPATPFIPGGQNPGNQFIPAPQGGHGSYVPGDQQGQPTFVDPSASYVPGVQLAGGQEILVQQPQRVRYSRPDWSWRPPAYSDPATAGDPGYAAYFNHVNAVGGGSNYKY